jgi:Zinc finger C-x8-C-x5-C-x3-H type (and similar)
VTLGTWGNRPFNFCFLFDPFDLHPQSPCLNPIQFNSEPMWPAPQQQLPSGFFPPAKPLGTTTRQGIQQRLPEPSGWINSSVVASKQNFQHQQHFQVTPHAQVGADDKFRDRRNHSARNHFQRGGSSPGRGRLTTSHLQGNDRGHEAYMTSVGRVIGCESELHRKTENGHTLSTVIRSATSDTNARPGGFKTVSLSIPGCPVQRFRICVSNHPDDIKQWIEERKAKFPRMNKSLAAPNSHRPFSNKRQDEETGLSALLSGYGSSSSDDHDDGEDTKPDNVQDRELESKNHSQGETSSVHESVGVSKHTSVRKRLCRYFAKNGTCRNGNDCSFSHEVGAGPWASSTRSAHNAKASGNTAFRLQPSLLQTLLQKESRREASLTIQLLKCIVENKFFQREEEKSM